MSLPVNPDLGIPSTTRRAGSTSQARSHGVAAAGAGGALGARTVNHGALRVDRERPQPQLIVPAPGALPMR